MCLQELLALQVAGKYGCRNAGLCAHIGDGRPLWHSQTGYTITRVFRDAANVTFCTEDLQDFESHVFGCGPGLQLSREVDIDHSRSGEIVCPASHGHGHIETPCAHGQGTHAPGGGGMAV